MFTTGINNRAKSVFTGHSSSKYHKIMASLGSGGLRLGALTSTNDFGTKFLGSRPLENFPSTFQDNSAKEYGRVVMKISQNLAIIGPGYLPLAAPRGWADANAHSDDYRPDDNIGIFGDWL